MWRQVLSVCVKAFICVDLALNHSPSLGDASYFSRHVPIYHLLSSQACFLMIRIIYTSFTFIDLLLFLIPKTVLHSVFPSSSLPALPFFYKDSNIMVLSLACSFLHISTALWVTLLINFLQTKPLYSEAVSDPAPAIFLNRQNRIPEIGSVTRQGSLYFSGTQGGPWAEVCRVHSPQASSGNWRP